MEKGKPAAASTAQAPATEGQASQTTADPGINAETISAMFAKFNSDIRAEFGRELKAIKEALGPQKPTAPEDETRTDKTLKDRLAMLESREAKARGKALRLTIRDALAKAGADLELAESMVPKILEDEGSRFVVTENSYGDPVVAYGDVAVTDWAKAWMQSGLGKRIAAGTPAPSAPLPNGSAGSTKSPRRVHISQAKGLSAEELRSGEIEIFT